MSGAVASAQDLGSSAEPILMTVQPGIRLGLDPELELLARMSPHHNCVGVQGCPREGWLPSAPDPDLYFADDMHGASSSKIADDLSLGIGRSFVANNFFGGPPADNHMAISNSGFIVSADNSTIDFYRDTPDSLLQFQPHRDFFGDSLLYDLPFDPRVIYDRYADRFIVVMVYTLGSNSDLLVSFSKSDDPRDGWNHYRVDADTLDADQSIDFPQIAVNRDELFISGNMVADNGAGPLGNKLFQIRKQDGYDSIPLRTALWTDILDADGNLGYFLCPLSDGLMADSYNRGIFLASTEFIDVGQTGTKLYWYHLTDSIGAAGATINSRQLSSGQPYTVPPVGFQLGSSDYLDFGNCRIHSGFHLGGKLYFVYCKNTNSFCTIVLNRVDTQLNSLQRDSWGFSAGQQDDSYPSIAFSGVDSTEADKILMCFNRSGGNIFIQMRAVYFDSVFSANSMLVKNGDGYLDLIPNIGVAERFGDYTATQRRYGALTPTCWAVASYPVGSLGNHFGVQNGLNAFIAEFTDSLANAVSPTVQEPAFSVAVFPNPITGQFTVVPAGINEPIDRVELIDLQGRLVQSWHGIWQRGSAYFSVGDQSSGYYLLRVHFRNNRYGCIKVLVD